jgi:hypothetical protein
MAMILKPIKEAGWRTEKSVYRFGAYLEDIFLPLCRRK